ncbi:MULTISPECIES: sensor histidine kinase KdpD [unclassified Neglectibacter]|uniref:sensor histidine kinase n=1 Tax=unclassified Neglectibacter TaxID=2632164 RepID=UPI00191C06B6|nr:MULTISPECIES: HAMP domain-containing sensor histidine kinase [unclassified Neglectibacter]
MKIKISKTTTLIGTCILGIAACFGLYYLVDKVWNGFFVDWFTAKYMNTHEVYSADVGKDILVTEPLWSELKVFILTVLIIIVLICIAITFAVANLHAKAEVRKSITATSVMLHDFMIEEKGNIDIYPKEYAEISAQMSEIKSTMQRHEQMLKEEASRKNDLIAYLAHDLKTPLTSVIGYLALLDEAQDMPIEQKTKYVNIALSKALRLEKLINEFFDITRYNLQQIDLEKESINLCHMLVQMTDEFYPLLNAHGNQTEVCVDEDVTVYRDSMKLARVFNNILKNAIYYSYPDTIIKIWAESTDTDVWIYFCNKGKTIPAGKLNSIFEKFFRMDEARSTNTGGAGLGLAIAKEIITLHGGKITAESENESTTFRISLPVTH